MSSVTEESLKKQTKQFDLLCIFSLELSHRELEDVTCLGRCSHLIRLNLSRNNIRNLSCLESLKELKYLNVAHNKLSSLDGISGLEALVYLNLDDALKQLVGLEKLRTLLLQDASQGTANPICQSSLYRASVLRLLPQIHILDGEHIRGQAKDLFQLCNQLQSQIKGGSDVLSAPAVSLPEPFLSETFWEMSTACSSDESIASALKEFNSQMSHCRKLNAQATAVIRKARDEDK
ncbi:leucine-rich repeat-containing protein 61-like isoform X2 [Oscarella lobularis]|uniref:leucine-rich repeat-containing protein 61-like isoform X2 n=1 Tax=Oscarella lobularis TaxID=121494 RepID=UPI0033142177